MPDYRTIGGKYYFPETECAKLLGYDKHRPALPVRKTGSTPPTDPEQAPREPHPRGSTLRRPTEQSCLVTGTPRRYRTPPQVLRETRGILPSEPGQAHRIFIPEGDLYRLLVLSQLPTAERFKCRMFDEAGDTDHPQCGYRFDRPSIYLLIPLCFSSAIARRKSKVHLISQKFGHQVIANITFPN